MTLSALYQLFRQHPVTTTDTRNCPAGSIFFALKGANFNGNHFALQALEAGCAYAVVDEAEVAAADERCLLFDDVLTTLQQLAALHRRTLGTPILQITGTNGKTTTKELTAAVLSEKYDLLYTLGNFNNHIGVPKTLLRLTPEHEFAVVETGANHCGEIAELSAIVQPDCGLITNVGKAHLEGFGSFEGVVRTKTELYAHLRKTGGFVFLHGDNPYLAPKAEGMKAITYGAPSRDYDIEGEVVGCDPFVSFRWRQRGGAWHTIQTQLIGTYNLDNLLAAVAVGVHFGVAPESIDAALSQYAPTNNRSEFRRTAHNRLVVDAYNANLSSMRAAIENFRAIEADNKMLILGEMREMGDASVAAHAEVMQLTAAMGDAFKEVWFVGDEFEKARVQMDAETTRLFRYFDHVEAVKSALKEHPLHNRFVLIKGSNGTRLFELPEWL